MAGDPSADGRLDRVMVGRQGPNPSGRRPVVADGQLKRRPLWTESKVAIVAVRQKTSMIGAGGDRPPAGEQVTRVFPGPWRLPKSAPSCKKKFGSCEKRRVNRTSKSRTSLVTTVLAAAAGLALDVAVAAAEDSSGAPAEVDEIVVRATRLDKRIDDIPASVSVVTQDEIQLGRQQLGLDESLAAVPGLFMLNRYNFAQDLRIAIRGFGARSNFGIRGVKILVDGIPESLPDGQGQSDGIDLGSATQIEVIRGPASSLYGNASGGVINITTEAAPADPFIESRLSIGDFDFRKVQLKTGGQADRLNYLISLSDMRLDGYRDHSDTEDTLLNTRFVYAVDDESEISLVFNSTDQPVADDPGGVTLPEMQADPAAARQRNVDFDAGESLDQQRLGLSYRKSIGDRHEVRVRNHYVWRDFANKLPFQDGGIVSFDRIIVGGGATYTYTGEVGGRPNNLIVGVDVDRQDDDRQRFSKDRKSVV